MANRDTTITLLIKANAAQLNQALQQAGVRARVFGDDAENAGRRAKKGFEQSRSSVEAIGHQLGQAKAQLLAFVGLQGAGTAIAGLARAADSYANLTAKIKLATTSQASFNLAEDAVFAISQRTSTQLDATATLFGRLSGALKDQGGSQREVLGLTETINKALAVSGATGAETASVIVQLSQAFAAGRLSGDEFNSVNDAGPRLMKALAESMGVTVGELKALAEAGKLTSDQLRTAFSGDQAKKIAAEFNQLPLTIERSLTQLDNAFTRFIGQQDRAMGVSAVVAGSIQGLSQNFDGLANVVGVIVVAGLGRLIATLVTAGAAKVAGMRKTQQLAQEELAQARAAETAAQAELARARALTLSGTGTTQVAAAEAGLAAAQARTTAATQAATAAVGAKAVAVRALSSVLTLMGGPLGLAITGVTLLASAFATASANAKAAKIEFESTIKAAQRFREQQDIDSGVDVGKRLIDQRQQLQKELENLQILRQGIGPLYGGAQFDGGQSSGRLLFGKDVDAEIKRVQTQLARTNQEFNQVRDSLTELRTAQASGGRTRLQVTKEAGDFTKALTDQNEKLKVERIEREKGLRAALEYQAVKAAGVKDTTQLTAAMRQAIDVQVREREAAEAATAAGRAQTKAQRDAVRQQKADERQQARDKKDQEKEQKKERKTSDELDKTVGDAEFSLLRNRGDTAAARQRELLLEHRESLAELLERGRTSDWLKLNLSIDTQVAQAQLDDLQGQVERVFGQQSRDEQSIQTRQQAGLLTEIGARRELIDLHARTAAEVEQLLPKMNQLAAKTGSPESIERVKDLTAQVAALKTQSNELVVTLTNGFESGLSNALEGLATGTLTLRQALTGLVQDMARSMAQLAAQQLAAMATAKLMSVIGKIGGAKTPDLAQPDPVQAATAGAAYALPIAGASAALGAAGGVVMAAAIAMQAAAKTMLAANAAKTASGFFASGGFTGIGPKYAPAGVVHRGEFVHRREVVRQPGARSFLERFNRVGMASIDGLRGYAAGGFVSPAPRAPATVSRSVAEQPGRGAEPDRRSGQITNVLYLDPREIVNVMGTQAGRQVILSTIRANAPTVRQDLG
ncbi:MULTISPECIES: tape measure protein [unclassified Lysobacter]|uniref:tape measure protein n=1 Tax=unclassified Lysobacter TaxID=2635362 RepID=UPI001BE5F830|nr:MULTISPECIES: tape measure protein [unclassified Lysobacter]MBT2750013.1 tape measure protein [Lysobacter sp. ISL-50]MBT2775415.1 tape measure protein [Lysobacter sp. ISL-54]MBT2783538.1 tape measure protein [Lysobacter sp. ISL-52]